MGSVAVVLVLAVSGCTSSNPAPPPPTTGTVRGQVTAGGGPPVNKGGPVANGMIWFYDGSDGHIVKTTRTDQTGHYSVALAPGSYTLAFTPCIQGRQHTAVAAGETTQLNLLCSMR
jgi:hypothetical protein